MFNKHGRSLLQASLLSARLSTVRTLNFLDLSPFLLSWCIIGFVHESIQIVAILKVIKASVAQKRCRFCMF